MNFGITGNIGGYYLSEQHRKNIETAKNNGVSFADSLAIANAEEQDNVSEISFKDMLKAKYPEAYYNVMDTSKIDGNLWGRNDYPWDAYFSEPVDESVLNWKPSGAEPPMLDSNIQSKINSICGKMSIVIPQALEEKMKSSPKLAQQVIDKIDGFISQYYRPGANQGFLMTFDENGEINHACITSGGQITVSSSEFADARKAREKKQAERNRIIEENAIKRKIMEIENNKMYYENNIKKAASVKTYENIMGMTETPNNINIDITNLF